MMDMITFLPEIFLALFVLMLLLGGVFGQETQPLSSLVKVGRIFLAASLLSLLGLAVIPWDGVPDHTLFFSKTPLVFWVQGILLMSLWPSLAMASPEASQFEYYVLLGLSALGMMVLVSASHLLTFYLGVELQALPFYGLLALRRKNGEALEAALKYFILGAVASGILLFGMAFLYGATGQLGFDGLQEILPQHKGSPLVLLGSSMVVVALLFKLSAAPFHFWAPDVYAGATNRQVAVMAISGKIALLLVVARFFFHVFESVSVLKPVLVGAALCSLYVGALGALRQSHLRRFLAYAGINQMGFLLLAFCVPGGPLTPLLIYSTGYFLSLILFLQVVTGFKISGKECSLLSSLKGLSKRHPRSSVLLSLALFSMAGIPPLAGFWGKFALLVPMIETGAFVVVLLVVLSSVIAAAYYLKLVKDIYFESEEEEVTCLPPRISAYLLGGCLLLFFVLQTFIPLDFTF